MTSEPGDKSSGPAAVGRTRSKRIILLLLAICGVGVFVGCQRNSADPTPLVTPTSKPAPDEDVRLGKMVLGVWTDNYKGKRTMTLLEDGTGTMLVELSGLNAIFASKMRFDMVWSVEKGRLKKRTIGGEPAGRVRMILATMGDRVDEPILELTDKRLLLLDADGETKYDWRRVDVADGE
jgi:hypothetical protein